MERKLMLSFPPESTYRPVTYELVKDHGIRINIINAEIEIGKGGRLLVVLDAEPEKIDSGIKYLKDNGVAVSSLADKVFYNEASCTNCGSCASSCPVDALTISAPDWKLRFNPDSCIICRMCLTSCPLKLFSMELSE